MRHQCLICGRKYNEPRICRRCYRFTEPYTPRRQRQPQSINITVDGKPRRIITQK